MGFYCDAQTRERLEWPRLLEWLSRGAGTERGRAACRSLPFSPTRSGARERLAETSAARSLLDADEPIPFGGVSDLRPATEELARRALVSGDILARFVDTLGAGHRIRSFLRERARRVPALARLGDLLPDLLRLTQRLERCVTPEGALRDSASAELKRLRRLERDHEREIERRMSGCLRDPRITPHLQDHYSTFREGRPVLPVRAEARGQVRGIVHDVSSSGTTVFVEPEAVVEVSNKLRLVCTELRREVDRILRELGAAVLAERLPIETLGDTLELLDVAQARGRLSARLDAVEPEIDPGPDGDPGFALRGLCHPLLLLESGLSSEQVVSNACAPPPGVRALVVSGPNAGGKTVYAKAIGLAALSLRAGLHVPCDAGSGLPLFNAVCAEIGDEQDLRSGLSTFSARMTNLAAILGVAAESGDRTLAIVDEVGEGTEPGEGAALAQSILEGLVDRSAWVVATTHFNRLKELAASDDRFCNVCAEFDPDTLYPTYRIHTGAPGSSGAMWVAERMGLDAERVERARALLDREDRKLESLTRSLSELRQELESERRRAERVAQETDEARTAFRARLAALRGAREEALASMRDDLDLAFREAREEIAVIMRDVQRTGSASSREEGRAANRARSDLDRVASRIDVAERERAESVASEGDGQSPIDWEALAPGARLLIESIPGEAVLLERPDRRGRVQVRAGGVRMSVPCARVRGASAPRSGPPGGDVEVVRAPTAALAPVECDLRGLRVDEALERADAHLNRVLGTGTPSLCFIHGHGTGALRSAIRAWLRDLPGVSDFGPGDPRGGGNGVTVVRLD